MSDIKIAYVDKIKELETHGYIKLTEEYLNKLKSADNEKYLKLIGSIVRNEERGKKVVLVVFIRNAFLVYSDDYIKNNTVEDIIKGTMRLL